MGTRSAVSSPQFLVAVTLTALAGLGEGCYAGAVEDEAASDTTTSDAPASADASQDDTGSQADEGSGDPEDPGAAGGVPPGDGPGIPASGHEGILDCPTTALPVYEGPRGRTEAPANATLSSTFETVCASCHGTAGEGRPGYPEIPGSLTREQFIGRVRVAQGAMPAFDSTAISDQELAEDFEALRDGASGGLAAGVYDWSDADYEQALELGLRAWRTPDEHGAACASCHAPDAIDLAILGYSDDALLRRALQHVPVTEASAIRDYVHAQRRRFHIARTCDPIEWRPLQPGGRVLPGDTVQAREVAFFEELQRQGLRVADGAVETLEDADAAWEQLASYNLRRVPMGIELPRWTEDSFRGSDHNLANEWITSVPRIPDDEGWYERLDAYIADPTLPELLDIVDATVDMTHDGGFADLPGTNDDLNRFFISKYESTLLATHYFRMALLGRPGWYEQSDAIDRRFGKYSKDDVTQTQNFNPMNAVGFAYQEDHCYNNDACRSGQLQSISTVDGPEFEGVTPGEFPDLMRKQATHTWWLLGLMTDPTLAGRTVTTHYWLNNGDTFPEKDVHRPFITAVIAIARVGRHDRHDSVPGVEGLLDGNTMARLGWNGPAFGRPTGDEANATLIVNISRTVLLRMRRSLQEGGAVGSRSLLLGTIDRLGEADGESGLLAAEVRALVNVAEELG